MGYAQRLLSHNFLDMFFFGIQCEWSSVLISKLLWYNEGHIRPKRILVPGSQDRLYHKSVSDPTLQNLKEITADYDALIPAAEKQLGASDPQVRSLKTLRATFNQSVNDLKNSQKTQK